MGHVGRPAFTRARRPLPLPLLPLPLQACSIRRHARPALAGCAAAQKSEMSVDAGAGLRASRRREAASVCGCEWGVCVAAADATSPARRARAVASRLTKHELPRVKARL